jgi:hypothetical protein
MMYKVILIAEDGEYTLAGPMSEQAAIEYCDNHDSNYGEGQQLCIERA